MMESEPKQDSEPPIELVALPGIPFPRWLIVFTGITGLAFSFGLARIGHAFGAGLSYERAQKHLIAKRPDLAVTEFKKVAEEHPDSVQVKIDLVDALNANDDLLEAATLLESLEGLSATQEQVDRVERLGKSLAEKADALSAEFEKLEKDQAMKKPKEVKK